MSKSIIVRGRCILCCSRPCWPLRSLSAPRPLRGRGRRRGRVRSPDYGDLVVLYRNATGVPILESSADGDRPGNPGGHPVDGGSACSPLPLPASCLASGDDPGTSDAIPCETPPDGNCLIPVDQYSCSVLPEYAIYTQEVAFERINVARSPERVLAQQLEDAIINLATADCISLDPAGRLVHQRLDVNDSDGDGDTNEYLSTAIDAPAQNLAIYKQLMLTGVLGDPAITLPQPWPNYGFLDTAAKGIGAAASKEGSVNVDLVVYLNQFLGLSDETTATVLAEGLYRLPG